MKNKIVISITNGLNIEVESEELNFKDLKNNAEELFKFVKDNLAKSKSSTEEVV